MKFSATPPTKQGAYWWRPEHSVMPHLLYVEKVGLIGMAIYSGYSYRKIVELGGEWSPRLVPVDEVEKAYAEGFNMAEEYLLDNYNDCWNESRTKQVVEGEIVEEKGAK